MEALAESLAKFFDMLTMWLPWLMAMVGYRFLVGFEKGGKG